MYGYEATSTTYEAVAEQKAEDDESEHRRDLHLPSKNPTTRFVDVHHPLAKPAGPEHCAE
jgi:hypothetical protein